MFNTWNMFSTVPSISAMLVVLLLLGAAATQVSAQGQTVLCGRELAKAHSMYCYGIDPSPAEAGETQLPTFPEADGNLISVLKIPARFAYRARRAAEARRSSASLVEACCLKPCLVAELLNHC